MAKKRGGKESSSKSKSTSKSRKGISRMNYNQKFNLTIRNFLTFGVLALAFFAIYQYVTQPIYQSIFWFLLIVSFFISLAFLIVFLAVVLSRSRAERKRQNKK